MSRKAGCIALACMVGAEQRQQFCQPLAIGWQQRAHRNTSVLRGKQSRSMIIGGAFQARVSCT
jgi:hypothetical protein